MEDKKVCKKCQTLKWDEEFSIYVCADCGGQPDIVSPHDSLSEEQVNRIAINYSCLVGELMIKDLEEEGDYYHDLVPAEEDIKKLLQEYNSKGQMCSGCMYKKFFHWKRKKAERNQNAE